MKNKKILILIAAIVIVAVIVVAVVFAGGNNNNNTTEDKKPTVQTPATALEVLNNVWALYGEDERFPVVGGTETMGAAGAVTPSTETLYALYIDEASIASISDAATMFHMMNTNTFYSASLILKDGTDVNAFVNSLKDTLLNTNWICGFPETLHIATIGNCVVVAYGYNDLEAWGDVKNIDAFAGKLAEAYKDATVVVNENFPR